METKHYLILRKKDTNEIVGRCGPIFSENTANAYFEFLQSGLDTVKYFIQLFAEKDGE